MAEAAKPEAVAEAVVAKAVVAEVAAGMTEATVAEAEVEAAAVAKAESTAMRGQVAREPPRKATGVVKAGTTRSWRRQPEQLECWRQGPMLAPFADSSRCQRYVCPRECSL